MTGPRPVATRRYSSREPHRRTVRRLRIDLYVCIPRSGGGHFRPGQDLDALTLERLLELGRNRVVFDRHETRQELDDGHIAAEPAKDGREFDADRAASEDDDGLGNVLQADRFVTGDDSLAVDRDARNAARLRSGGDDNLARRGEHLRLAVSNLDPALAREPAAALDPVDLVLLEEELDAAGQALDDLVLARLHLRHVDANRRLTDRQAPVLPLLRNFEGVRVFEERLGRDAPPIEAGAAKRRGPLDDRGLQPELRRTDGRHIAARSRADDHDVVRVLSRHR